MDVPFGAMGIGHRRRLFLFYCVCHLLRIVPKQPFLTAILGVFLRPIEHIHQRRHLRGEKLIPARCLHLVQFLGNAREERRNPLPAALIPVQEGEDRTHFRAVLVLREKCLCTKIVLDTLTAPAQCVKLLHRVADCVLQLLDVWHALLDREPRHHRRGRHHAVADVANVVIRTLCHLGDELIVPVGNGKDRTLHALNPVGIRVSVLVEVRIHLVFPDKFMKNPRDKTAVRSSRKIPLVIRNIRIHHGIGDLLRVLLCGFACAHTRSARSRTDNVLHQTVRNIALHLTDKHRILDALNILFGKPELLRILHEIGTVRRSTLFVACLRPLYRYRAPVAVENNAVAADERRTLIEIASVGKVFGTQAVRHARHLLAHHDALAVTRLQSRRIARIDLKCICVMRGDEIIGGYNTVLHRDLLPTVGVDRRLFPLRIGTEIGGILHRDHPRHDRLHLGRCPAARPCERLIDSLEIAAELGEYRTQSLCRCFPVLEIPLESTGKTFVLPLTLELIRRLLVAPLECGTDFCVEIGELRFERCPLVLRRLPLTPRRPLPHGLKLLGTRR